MSKNIYAFFVHGGDDRIKSISKNQHILFREPLRLPKTIPPSTIEKFLSQLYISRSAAKTPFQRKNALRDIAVIELLFATGMRISELCSLKRRDLDLQEKKVLIYGKGAKERVIYIGSTAVIALLDSYITVFSDQLIDEGWLFLNQRKNRLSEQSVRNMINKYARQAEIQQHITPHMFRHSFATLLLESDVDYPLYKNWLATVLSQQQKYIPRYHTKTARNLCIKHPRNKDGH